MKVALLAAVILFGCGSRPATGPTSSQVVAPAFPATRWVPANPTYVLASPSVKDMQRSLRDAIEGLGMFVGVETSDVSAALRGLLAVDPLDASAVSGMGIDLEGGIAVFSEDLSPTFVVRLSSPDQTQAFFDKQRERGMVTQSVIVDGTEIFTANLLANVKVSWGVADSWLWVHFTIPGTRKQGSEWFTNSRKPESSAWASNWQWSQKVAGANKPALTGFLDRHALVGAVAKQFPNAVACTKLVDPVTRVAVAIDADPKSITGRVTLDIGASAASLAAASLPAPDGFGRAAGTAPIAAQWNLDLVTLRGWTQPCLVAINEDLGWLDRFGVRAGRAFLESFDSDDKSKSRGFVSLELAHQRYLANLLDEIPLRSTLERSRKYGPHSGHSLSVPFVATVDYVLTDKIALAAIGDGLLAKIVGSGGTKPGPIAAVDLAPPALAAAEWKALFGLLDFNRVDRLVERMLRWREGHFAIAVDGSALVVTVSGTRR